MEPQQHQAGEERRLGFFEGPIADALALARQSPGLVLVVSLQEEGHEQAEPVGDHGSTGVEASRRLNAETWSHPDVVCRLKEATVALRLDWRSPDGVSFLAIYPAFQVPTIYLIAPLTGQPLGILIGHVTPQQFLAKLDECSAALASPSPVVPAPAFSTTDAPPPHEPTAATITPTATTTAVPQRPTGEDEQRANDTEQHHSPPDASPGSRPLPAAEVAAQKEQLLKRLEQAKRQKEAQEKEAERERELARRRNGKAALETLKTIEEINKRKEIEQRRREKSEAERHKALVREKIRRDRELRAQQQQAASPSSAATNAPPVPEAPSSAPPTTAAIAFRMPDGSLEKADFAATSTLADCRKHLRTVVGLQGHFGLMTNFPRHVFTEDEYSRTLRALQLCPSATLIVTGATEHASSGDGPAVRGAEGAGFISYLWSFFGGSSSSASSSGASDHDYPQQQQQQQQQQPPQATAPSSRQPLGRGSGGSGAGNVHGLRRDDDMAQDADNAYWNGNSTQQY